SEGNQLAVNARPENVPRLDVEVGRPPLYRRLDDLLHAYSSLRLVVVPGLRSAGWPNESARLSTLPACLRGSSAASPLGIAASCPAREPARAPRTVPATQPTHAALATPAHCPRVGCQPEAAPHRRRPGRRRATDP